jgi:Zn-dependent protease with chaperone function
LVKASSPRSSGSVRDGGDFYPASPAGAPPLALMNPAYLALVVLVLGSLVVFVAVYLGLLVASAWLLAWSLSYAATSDGDVVVKAALLATSPMLVLFFLKGLFKGKFLENETWLEVKPEEQPDLHRFVERLCADAGSVLPGKLYLTWDINAMVTYPSSLLALAVPARKNLLIGMGLVNALNLSELKAVLAHELGHFSQASTKLGQYVYVANQIVADMVHGRDRWDVLLARWRRLDFFLSWPAWLLTGVVFVLRTCLSLLFCAINLANFSLKRQMELNADRHAVRLCGSDALVSGLWKTERASIAFEMAWSDLSSLAQHNRFSDDLFFHHDESLARLDHALKKDPRTREHSRHLIRPYRPGPEIHFPVSSRHAATMWDAHPSMRDREKNAKRAYVAQPADERRAWEIFRSSSELRAALSVRFYRELCGLEVDLGDLLPANEVHEMILEERAEIEQGEHYQGFYEDRCVLPGDVRELAAAIDRDVAAGKVDRESLRREAAEWVGERMRETASALRKLREDLDVLYAVQCGHATRKGATFEFRGQRVDRDSVDSLRAQVQKEIEALDARMQEGDRVFFRYFYCISGAGAGERGGAEVREELMRRYDFLGVVQEIVTRLDEVESRTLPILQAQQGRIRFTPDDLEYIRTTFAEGRDELERAFQRCTALVLPRLVHLDKEYSAASFVLPTKRVIPPFAGPEIPGAWVAEYLRQFQQVLTRLRKLHFKNLGKLLKLQETLDPALFGAAVGAGGAGSEGEAVGKEEGVGPRVLVLDRGVREVPDADADREPLFEPHADLDP